MSKVLTGVQLRKKDGSVVVSDEALKGKVVLFYFFSSQFPPCLDFTPLLKDFYGELEEDNSFAVIFVSFDDNEAQWKKYMEVCHYNWFHFIFGSEEPRKLYSKYAVSGIPALIVVDENGTTLSSEGKTDILMDTPSRVLIKWKRIHIDKPPSSTEYYAWHSFVLYQRKGHKNEVQTIYRLLVQKKYRPAGSKMVEGSNDDPDIKEVFGLLKKSIIRAELGTHSKKRL